MGDERRLQVYDWPVLEAVFDFVIFYVKSWLELLRGSYLVRTLRLKRDSSGAQGGDGGRTWVV